jgi:hypothetical protein
LSSSITGSAVVRAGGGAGSGHPNTPARATPGSGYLGSGGGGHGTSGQNGIVIVRYLTSSVVPDYEYD